MLFDHVWSPPWLVGVTGPVAPTRIRDPAGSLAAVAFLVFLTAAARTGVVAANLSALAARRRAFGRLARTGLGLSTVSFTLSQIFYLRVTAYLVPKWIPPNQMFCTILTTVAFALAAIAILINRQARLATRLMTFMLALFGVLVWIPRLIASPQAHLNWSEFALTFLITGATWMVADLKSF